MAVKKQSDKPLNQCVNPKPFDLDLDPNFPFDFDLDPPPDLDQDPLCFLTDTDSKQPKVQFNSIQKNFIE